MSVADGDGEPAEVSPDDLDCLVCGAGYFQTLPLALVSSFVAGSIGANSWNDSKHFTEDHSNVSDGKEERYFIWLGSRRKTGEN